MKSFQMLQDPTPAEIIACQKYDADRREMCAYILSTYGETLASKDDWLNYPESTPQPNTLYLLKIDHDKKTIDARGSWDPDTKKWKCIITPEAESKSSNDPKIMEQLLEEKLTESQMSHNEIVEIAHNWVLKNARCGVAFKELATNACNSECPDVIGFSSWGHSVLVEVKTSRSDFHADKKKLFRQHPDMGMGTYRFYCCPTGLLTIADLPTNWGLIYVNEKGKAKCVHNPYTSQHGNYWQNGFEKNFRAEHGLMYSALRRLQLRGRIPEVYTPIIPEKPVVAKPEPIDNQHSLFAYNPSEQ